MKKLIGAILVVLICSLFAVCGTGALAAPQVTATPVSSTSRGSRSEPVPVTENYAKTDVVESSTVPAPSAAPSAQSAAPAAETPATGDFPLVYVAGAVGLILICSAGLVMLRRI